MSRMTKKYAMSVAGAMVASLLVVACSSADDSGSAASSAPSEAEASQAPAPEASEAAPEVSGDCDPNLEMTLWRPGDASAVPLGNAIDRFNAKSECGTILWEKVPSETIDEKLRMTLGTDQGPDIFVSHGGAHLWEQAADPEKTFVPADASLADSFWPWALDLTTLNGTNYGIPAGGTEPVMLFYNKAILAENNIEPPQTYEDLLAAVDILAQTEYIPIVVAGQAWVLLMWWEWLVDRVGGETVWQKCVAGDWQGCWSDPAMLKATELIVQLIDHGAFADNWASVDYGAGGSEPLMTEGMGAFYLMGSWGYTSMLTADPDFVKENIGFMNPPKVADGIGNPKNVFGNPSRSMIITDKANVTLANAFAQELISDEYVSDTIELGQVPTNKNAVDFFDVSPTPEFTQFVLQMTGEAPYFTQSWDVGVTELGSTAEPEMERVFLRELDAQGFIDAVLALDPSNQ